MSTNKKIKTDNNNKIFQDIIDFKILRSLIDYLLISKNNKNNNNNHNTNNNNNSNISNNQYKIDKFYLYGNEILNYILVSKKWYNFISLTISNNIINNNLFEHWLKIFYDNNKSFIENYNNQNQFNKNNLIFKSKEEKLKIKQYKISFNKEFSIIKVKESIINDYFKFNLILNNITIDDFKEIKNKFENNQLDYNRIIVNLGFDETSLWDIGFKIEDLFEIREYVSNENSEIISNLFKILGLNLNLREGYFPDSEVNKKCTELYFNTLFLQVGVDQDIVEIFKIFKGKNLIYDATNFYDDYPLCPNYSALFDPDNSGQQIESIKVKNQDSFEECVEVCHLIKVNQFENLHSIEIPINSFQILSNLSEEMGFNKLYHYGVNVANSDNMKSKLNQTINSFITSKSLKNLKITLEILSPTRKIGPEKFIRYDGVDNENFVNCLNKTTESYSNSFQPLFSELNTSIERIEFECCSLLNINTFSNLLNNKSIKYLYLHDSDSDFIAQSLNPTGNDGGRNVLHKESISINQYLFENIFSSPLTSVRHYRINLENVKEIKFIFNLIFNNIFKLQLYSLIFELNEFNGNILIGEFIKEYKKLINNISQGQQQQQQEHKSNNIYLKEFKFKFKIKDEYIQELKNIKNQYFTTVVKKIASYYS
ncbi:hypothetical protein ACTFIR_012077 [Dictyostelium discoideum]